MNDISELINRRRRQILIHSILYYELNEAIIPDNQWTEWAKELKSLQEKYPEIAKNCVYADEFKNFDYISGYYLPLRDPWGMRKARQLLTYHYLKGEIK